MSPRGSAGRPDKSTHAKSGKPRPGTGGYGRKALEGKGCWIEGNATPFGMYAKLYRHRDQFVVIIGISRVLRMFHPLIPIRSPLQ